MTLPCILVCLVAIACTAGFVALSNYQGRRP